MQDAFLCAVLGTKGHQALRHLAASPAAAVLVPRAALAWVRAVGTHDGPLPGVPGVALVLRKTEQGYSGVIGAGTARYAFGAAPAAHAAAAICAFLAVAPGAPLLRNADMARLGTTMDLMVKAQVKPVPTAPAMTHEARPLPPHRRAVPQRGVAAAPQAPEAHAEPTGATPARARQAAPRPRPILKVRLPESRARRPCSTCGDALFAAGRFKGCACMGGLAKTVAASWTPGGYHLELGAGWDRDAVLAFLGDPT